MTRNEYLEELKKELKLNNIDEIDDIISEYNEHFDFKIEEGLTEDEIAKKLGSPKEIAKEYTPKVEPINKFEKGTKVTGLVFLSLPVGLVYLLAFASVAVLGAFSIASLVLGFSLITTINIAGLIPYIPYFPAFCLGLSCFSLATLSAIGTFYMLMYILQWGKVYIRWCRNVANNTHYPSISKHPKLSKKLLYNLKFIAIVGLVCFVTTFVVGYGIMCIMAKSFEPWHYWHWFD